MFVIEFLLDLITFPLRRFPKTTTGILVILAFGGAGASTFLHGVATGGLNDVCNIVVGHTGCIKL